MTLSVKLSFFQTVLMNLYETVVITALQKIFSQQVKAKRIQLCNNPNTNKATKQTEILQV